MRPRFFEGVGSSGHEPYLTPAGLRIISVRQVKIPVLVGNARNFHQPWRSPPKKTSLHVTDTVT